MQKISLIKQNILKYLDFKGVSKYEFYKETGISRGTLDNNSGMTEDSTAKFIAYAKDVNIKWLILGEGEMLKIEELSEKKHSIFQLRTDTSVEDQKIPLYDIEAAAGLVPLFENKVENRTDEYIVIPRAPKCDGAVFVTGDSMYPLLKSGDIIAYKQIIDFKEEIFWGEMYLLSIDMADEEYVAVKWIHKGDDQDHIKLVSENRHHQPKDVHLSKVRAMAMVKASIRINSMR